MDKVTVLPMVVLPQENKKAPVFIEYTPEYKKEHGLSNEIDRPNKFERTPKEEVFERENVMGAPVMASFKAPSAKDIAAAAAIIPVILENGKKIIIAIFDIRDIIRERGGLKANDTKPEFQAVVLPEEAAKVFSTEA